MMGRTLVARFKGELWLGSATMLTPLISIVANLIGAHYISPAEMGLFQTVMLITSYSAFFHCGVFNGFGRSLPISLGRGDNIKAQILLNSCWTTAKIVSAADILLSTGIIIYFAVHGYHAIYYWAMIAVLVLGALDPLSAPLDCVYRSCGRNKELGFRLAGQNAIALATGLLPCAFGLMGLVASRILQSISRLILLLFRAPLKPKGRGTWDDTKHLARSGFPLLLAGTLYGYFSIADRSIVASMMSLKDVGNLNLAGLVVNALQFVPLSISALLYPRIGTQYGRCGTSLGLRRYFWISLGLNLVAIVPMAAVAYFAIRPLTMAFLPKYSEGIAAAQIGSLGSIGFAFYGVSGIIAVVRRNTLYITFIACCLCAIWVLGAYLVKAGYGIEGVALARAAGVWLLCLFTVPYAFYLTTQDIRA